MKHDENNPIDRRHLRDSPLPDGQKRLSSFTGGSMTLLNNLMKVGGSAMIIKEIADRIGQTRITREQTLRRDKAGMLALGVALGGAVGALAGILLAPKAGKEMRDDLSRRSCEAWEKAKENVSSTGHRLVGALEEEGSRVRIAAEEGVDAAKESLNETSSVSEEVKG